MMRTVQLETVISPNGTITLPAFLNHLNQHRVILTLVDLEKTKLEATHILAQITEAYCQTDETDLNIVEIYENRNKSENRNIIFD
jgi:hypothetical protein